MPDRAEALAALDAVRDPKSGRGLSSAGLVQGLVVAPDRCGFMLEVAAGDVALYGDVRDAAEAALRALPGVTRVHVALTAAAPAAPARRTVARDEDASPPRGAARPAHVRRVVAVASGKGGVGKSTVAANLACAFAALGRRTGLLDADVYGPSVPRMMGVDRKPEVGADKKLQPVMAWGVACASVGLLVEEGAPMIWRGPMASSAVTQLLNDVAWGTQAEPLDVLVIDMPPGTGDVQLTLAQRTLIDGAVIVSTPQEVALIDVRRGAEMFRKTATPILGVLENMAFFLDAGGRAVEIFGRGGARRTADALGAPFLGEAPISIALREGGDAGRPIVATTPDDPAAAALLVAAAMVLERLDSGAGLRPPPTLVWE
jgi:ATP-binding protein involved in chromosome partitioning